MAQLAIHTICG